MSVQNVSARFEVVGEDALGGEADFAFLGWFACSSNKPTTSSATSPATPCCAPWPTPSAAACAATDRTRPAAGAGRNSRSPCPASTRPGSPQPPSGSAITVPANDRRTGNSAVITLTTSIGAALFPDHGDDLTTLLPAVDNAVSRAKDRGRDQTVTAQVR